MSVTLKPQRDGKLRPFWYGEYTEGGKRKVINLNIPWRGTPPEVLRGAGDARFEQSREEAKKALASFVDEAARKGRVEHLTERLIEMKTGKRVQYTKLADLSDRWEGLSRSRKLNPRHAAGCRSKFDLFIKFMATRTPRVKHLYEVKPEDAAAFVASVQEEYSTKTAGDFSNLLRAAFDRFMPTGTANPFREIVTNRRGDNDEDGTIHRTPLNAEQITTLLNYTREHDPLFCDLITAGICSGLRRGDICRLKWTSVDFEERMLTVKTSKTGAEVSIPLFDPLRAVLESRRNNGKPFCFPEAELMHRTNPQGLSWRFKVLAARAFSPPIKEQKKKQTLPPEKIQDAGLNAIDSMPPSNRRDRIRRTFTAYMAGHSVRDIEKQTEGLRSTISNDLHFIEQQTGLSFIRTLKPGSIKADVARVTRRQREGGKRDGSVIDWHCLRTSFVTLALSAGVPAELVKRITGHGSVDIILRHYFRPGREQFRAALTVALPDVLTGKHTALKPADELAALAGKVAAGIASTEDKTRLKKLAAHV